MQDDWVDDADWIDDDEPVGRSEFTGPISVREPGNIDLYGQPEVRNPNGGYSTVASIGMNLRDRETLLSSVTPDGRFLATPQAVYDEYQKTGKHLGKFNSWQESNAYAEQLHKDYENGKYAKSAPGFVPPYDPKNYPPRTPQGPDTIVGQPTSSIRKEPDTYMGGFMKGLNDYATELGEGFFESAANPKTGGDFLGLMLPNGVPNALRRIRSAYGGGGGKLAEVAEIIKNPRTPPEITDELINQYFKDTDPELFDLPGSTPKPTVKPVKKPRIKVEKDGTVINTETGEIQSPPPVKKKPALDFSENQPFGEEPPPLPSGTQDRLRERGHSTQGLTIEQANEILGGPLDDISPALQDNVSNRRYQELMDNKFGGTQPEVIPMGESGQFADEVLEQGLAPRQGLQTRAIEPEILTPNQYTSSDIDSPTWGNINQVNKRLDGPADRATRGELWGRMTPEQTNRWIELNREMNGPLENITPAMHDEFVALNEMRPGRTQPDQYLMKQAAEATRLRNVAAQRGLPPAQQFGDEVLEGAVVNEGAPKVGGPTNPWEEMSRVLQNDRAIENADPVFRARQKAMGDEWNAMQDRGALERGDFHPPNTMRPPIESLTPEQRAIREMALKIEEHSHENARRFSEAEELLPEGEFYKRPAAEQAIYDAEREALYAERNKLIDAYGPNNRAAQEFGNQVLEQPGLGKLTPDAGRSHTSSPEALENMRSMTDEEFIAATSRPKKPEIKVVTEINGNNRVWIDGEEFTDRFGPGGPTDAEIKRLHAQAKDPKSFKRLAELKGEQYVGMANKPQSGLTKFLKGESGEFNPDALKAKANEILDYIKKAGKDITLDEIFKSLKSSLSRPEFTRIVHELSESGQIDTITGSSAMRGNRNKIFTHGENADKINYFGVKAKRPGWGDETGSVPIERVTLKNPSPANLKKAQEMGYEMEGIGNDGKWRLKYTGKKASTLLEEEVPSKGKTPKEGDEKIGLPRQVYDLSRGMMSVDPPFMTSAAFRQAAPLAGTKNWFKAWSTAAKSFGSEALYNARMKQIQESPLFKPRPLAGGKVGKSFAEEIGVRMTDLKNVKGNRMEGIRSNLAESIPLYGRYIKASNRAFSGFLNDLRANQLEAFVKDGLVIAKAHGDESLNLLKNIPLAKEFGEFLNDATGAGTLKTGIGKYEYSLEAHANKVADVFFSPRLMARNIRMLNLNTYVMASKPVRKQYVHAMLRTVGAWWGVAQLGKMAGGEVVTNPTSPDFGKIKIGDTRLDPGAGFQQFLVLGSRIKPDWAKVGEPTDTGFAPVDLATGLAGTAGNQYTSSISNESRQFGVGLNAPTRRSNMVDFMANKFHPTAKLFWDIASANERQPVFLGDRMLQMYVPMMAGDIAELAQENPELIPLVLPFTGIGGGSQTYDGSPIKPQFTPYLGVDKWDIQFGGKPEF